MSTAAARKPVEAAPELERDPGYMSLDEIPEAEWEETEEERAFVAEALKGPSYPGEMITAELAARRCRLPGA